MVVPICISPLTNQGRSSPTNPFSQSWYVVAFGQSPPRPLHVLSIEKRFLLERDPSWGKVEKTKRIRKGLQNLSRKLRAPMLGTLLVIAWLLLSVRKDEVDFIDKIMNPFRYMKTPNWKTDKNGILFRFRLYRWNILVLPISSIYSVVFSCSQRLAMGCHAKGPKCSS